MSRYYTDDTLSKFLDVLEINYTPQLIANGWAGIINDWLFNAASELKADDDIPWYFYRAYASLYRLMLDSLNLDISQYSKQFGGNGYTVIGIVGKLSTEEDPIVIGPCKLTYKLETSAFIKYQYIRLNNNFTKLYSNCILLPSSTGDWIDIYLPDTLTEIEKDAFIIPNENNDMNNNRYRRLRVHCKKSVYENLIIDDEMKLFLDRVIILE